MAGLATSCFQAGLSRYDTCSYTLPSNEVANVVRNIIGGADAGLGHH